MQKTGIITCNGITAYIVVYTDNTFERIDVFQNAESYSPVNTENCLASYIFDGSARILGAKDFITKYNRIKSDAATLQVAEHQDVKVENGMVVLTISKQDPSEIYEYYKELVNGKLAKEFYKSDEGEIEFTNVSDSRFNFADKPVNYDEYTELSLMKSKSGRTSSFYSYEELLAKFPQVSHVLENDYVVAQSYEEAEERLNTWINSKEQLKSFDIESSGTDWGPTSQCRITGVFLGLGTEWSTYFPFRQDNFEYNLPIEYLRKIFDSINNQPPFPEVVILAHNVKFEIEGFYQEYRDYVRFDIDTYLLAVLADPKIKKGTHTLKALAAKVDDKFYLSLSDIFIGPVQFNVLPPNIVKLYGCPDATSPAKIYPYLMNKIPKDERFVIQLEMKMPVIKAMNEFYGIKLNQERLDDLLKVTEEDAEKLKSDFQRIHHTTRNINSNDVMSDILYNQLRVVPEVYTNKGQPATSKVAISTAIRRGKITPSEDTKRKEDIMSSNGKTVLVSGKDMTENKYPSLVIYQEYKKLLKEVGALRRLKNKSVAGFFKFYINQSGAGSNRQTSDAHQFDDTMKSCAVADSPHHQLVSCDWKQVELRILAGLAGQKDLIELESDPDVDIHRAILSIIQKKPMYLISEEDRKKGKSVNFGVVYMMSEYGLAQRDFGPGYTKENLIEERKKIDDFYNGLPYIKMFVKGNEEYLRKHGYIKTAFGYYRYFPELLDPTVDEKTKRRAIRAGNNTPVQGMGAQMLKIVETNVWNYIRKKGWDKEKDYDGIKLPMARMIVPIHDEILFSYDKSIPMEEIITMFQECMELQIDGMPPFFAAPAFIDNWYDGKNSVYEVDIPIRNKIIEEYKKGNYLLTGHDYVETLQEYRKNDIKEYLDELVAKYKTVDEVAAHVTDDNLTHVIIESQIPNKKERGKLTHMERIHEAVKRYMDNVDVSKIVYLDGVDRNDYEEKVAFEDWADDVFQVDAFGDVIIPEEDPDDANYYATDNVIQSPVTELPVYNQSRVIYALHECLIDFTGCNEDDFTAVKALCKEDAFYDLVILVDDKVVPTKLKIGYIPDELENIFKSKQESVV